MAARTALRASKKVQINPRGDDPPAAAMEVPERLLDSGAEEEDVQPLGYGGGIFMNMNQSIFGLIAAAGSTVDFNDRLEGQSSDDEDGDEGEPAQISTSPKHGRRSGHVARDGSVTQAQVLKESSGRPSKGERWHRSKLSENRLLKSVPVLSRLSAKSRSKSSKGKASAADEIEGETESSALPLGEPPSAEVAQAEGRMAPVMSRMLEARDEMGARPSFDLERPSSDRVRDGEFQVSGPSKLAKQLQEIFEFDQAEEVKEGESHPELHFTEALMIFPEYPCWLLQHVLLQGYMYLTTRHIAFYAYLPKKAVSPLNFANVPGLRFCEQHDVIKSGHLSKSGKRNPKFNRYWFRLKGDVLAYYLDSQNLYFPSGQIDLRYGISASIVDKDKDCTSFFVVTNHRTYHFRADSAPSAKEWVKCIQRVIFRSHNDGDSVKISLPLENVIDIEETQMLEFADTCKIRVIDNDETYAIDEVRVLRCNPTIS
jgi:sterol 3beta-glucosyltransferase